MEFVKKNVALVVVLLVTLLVSAYLIFMDWRKQHAVIKINNDITLLKSNIDDFAKKSPAPVNDNLEMIRKDTELMREKTQELQRLFGKPLRASLIAFAEALGLSETDLNKKFREYCVANPKESDKIKLLDGFLKSLNLPEEKVRAAYLAFIKTAQPRMVEEIRPESNAKVLLLQALGVPRTMSPTICKDYIIKTQELFAKAFSPLVTVDNVSKLTLIDYLSKVPTHDEIPVIIRKLQLFEDLFARLVESGVTQINSVEMLGSITGDEIVKDYLRFSYRLRVSGDMQSVKNLVNLLQDATKDNRVYSVKDISLQAQVDDAAKLDRSAASVAPRVMTASPRRDANPQQPQEAELPFEQRADYGVPVIGSNKLVNADIELDYFIYIGDELKH